MLPESKAYLCTNGTLLEPSSLERLITSVDMLTINNYSSYLKVSCKKARIVDYVRSNPDQFENMEIVVSMRFVNEVLSNRAGEAPNKQNKNNKYRAQCVLPYTDLTIYPDGRVGLCCSDVAEITCLGDLNQQSLINIWRGEEFKKVRHLIAGGRNNYKFCSNCDFFDTGHRIKQMEQYLGEQ